MSASITPNIFYINIINKCSIKDSCLPCLTLQFGINLLSGYRGDFNMCFFVTKSEERIVS